MGRHAFAVFLLLGVAGVVTALTTALVGLTSASLQPRASGHSLVEPVAASRSDDRLCEGDPPSPPERAAPLALAGPSTHEAPDAVAPSALAVQAPPDEPSAPVSLDTPEAATAAMAAVQPTPGDQAAALQQLVAQSQRENEQLGQMSDQLAAERRQAADDEARRQAKAEQAAAQHAATVAALATLRQASELLVNGNTDGLGDQLAGAEAALSGRRRLDVEAAREALARSDIFQARVYLAFALALRPPRGS